MHLFSKAWKSFFHPFLLFAVCISFSAIAIAQMPQWDWAFQVHGNQEDPIDFFDADNYGNTLIVGSLFSPAIIIGDTQLIRTSEYITNDGYVAVINNSGDVSWAKKIFATYNNSAQSIDFSSAIFDVHGNVLITGCYSRGDLQIDSIILNGGDNTSLGFSVKFDPLGNVLWSHLYEEGVNPTDIVCDKKGGFYLLGRMIWYCPQMDLGDTVLTNIGNQNQAFIAHYNEDNIVTWAKLFLGYADEINGASNEKGDLCFWGQFEGESYSIDSIILTNPEYNYHQNYFGICNNLANVYFARTISNNETSLKTVIFKNDFLHLIASFDEISIVIDGDTLLEIPGSYNTNFMSIFNYSGENTSTAFFTPDIPYTFNFSDGMEDHFNMASQISTDFWNGIDTMKNINGSSDPAVIYLDSDLNKIGGFSFPMTYNNSIPTTISDPFGNMIFISSIGGDTLVFGEDTLKNYQLQSQRDFYVAKSGECDNSFFNISMTNGSLYAINGIAWQWYLNDTLINYGTSQIFYPTYKGFYRVRVTLENGCYAWSNPYDYFANGQENNQQFINMLIFPNPANNLINIEINEPFDRLTIYNATGQKIASWESADQLTTTFYHHTPGFYFAYVTKNEIQTCIKFVIL